ncbi:MAG: penicillin-binding protein 2 [Candidatus Nealsonbacteria bacterium]|nr:MAG: penicillin-binding protein 2 [Candidatus Nealsonbacteria bacterium]
MLKSMPLFPKNKKFLRTLERKKIEIEEIFLDKFLKEEELKSRKLEVPLERTNFIILLLLGSILFGILLGVCFKLQIKEGRKYALLAARNQFVTSYLSAERGVIYDRYGEQLVWNEVNFDLWAKKSELLNNDEILKEISEIIGEDFKALKAKIEKAKEDEVLIKRNLSHQSLILLQANPEKFPGFEIKKRTLRHYKELASLAHLLGYLGKISSKELKTFNDYEIGDYIGKEGVERSYEQVLREKKGKIQIERDAKGNEISRKVISFPKSGDNLVLSLDLPLQEKAQDVLGRVLKEVGSEKGALVALNPQNGEILASVSLPFFDNNLFAKGITTEEFQALNQDPRNPQLNRVISGLYLTGSTIKPFVAAGALEEKVINEETELYCPLELCVLHKYTGEPECYGDWKFHGLTDVKKAIAESVNPFFYMIGGGYDAPPVSSKFFDPRLPRHFEGLGVERLVKYLRLFGLGQKTEIDLPGEMEGRVPTPEWKKNYFKDPVNQKWYLGDTYNLSIGQGFILATPLQIATAFQAIANGGRIFKPKIAKEIIEANGKAKKELNPEILKENFISKESLRIVKEGMCQAVWSPSGSAFYLSSLPVKVCAKTGTAQLYPQKEIYHNWITVFGPAENPEILLTIVIEEVKGTRLAAQKVAKEILEWYFSR